MEHRERLPFRAVERFRFSKLLSILEDARLPQCHMIQSNRWCQKVLEKWADGELKCNASEGLSIYPVIRHMLAELVMPSDFSDALAKAAVASYNALASVLDLLQRCKSNRDVSPSCPSRFHTEASAASARCLYR